MMVVVVGTTAAFARARFFFTTGGAAAAADVVGVEAEAVAPMLGTVVWRLTEALTEHGERKIFSEHRKVTIFFLLFYHYRMTSYKTQTYLLKIHYSLEVGSKKDKPHGHQARPQL